MKKQLSLLIFFFSLAAFSQAQLIDKALAGAQWKNNLITAAQEDYLSENEKMVFYYLNLARTQPQYFADSVLINYKGAENIYFNKTSSFIKSLYTTLKSMKPLSPLQAERSLYNDARCFALASGEKGYVGHERKGMDCARYQSAECCSYGFEKAIDIAVQLLIDEDVPSLGHRNIILGSYKQLGVSVQPHSRFRHIAVLNFK